MSVHHSDDCGEERSYTFRPMLAQKITFGVQASNDASICFAKHKHAPLEECYEVFLGGWEGEESAIRKGGSDDVVKVDSSGILSGDDFNDFWIKISRGVIKVGKRRKRRALMSFEDPDGLHGMRYYGFCTAYGAEGDWKFSDDKGEDSSSSSSSGCSSSDSEAEELDKMEQRPIMYKRPARWVPASGGYIPRRAVEIGESEHGMAYVGMANYEGTHRIGMAVPGEGVCHIPYNGEAATSDDFYILGTPLRVAIEWKAGSAGSIPPGALHGGLSDDGETLYIGRVMVDGKVAGGKVDTSAGLCFVTYDGGEHSHREYEVLCIKGMPIRIRP